MRTLATLATALFALLLGGTSLPIPSPAPAIAETAEAVDRPAWQVGDRWAFRWKAGTNAGEYTTVIEEVSDTGLTARSGNEFRYYTPDGGLMSVVTNSRVVAEYNPPLPLLQFPLKPGMSWQLGEGEDLTREYRWRPSAVDPGLTGEKLLFSC
jgi:hypothetical protein